MADPKKTYARKLRAVLASAEVLRYAHRDPTERPQSSISDWWFGGCGILARAIVNVEGKHAKLALLSEGTRYADHAVAVVRGCLIDGTGVHSTVKSVARNAALRASSRFVPLERVSRTSIHAGGGRLSCPIHYVTPLTKILRRKVGKLPRSVRCDR